MQGYSPTRIGAIIAGILGLVVVLFLGPQLGENLEANKIMVIQSPFSGDLTCHTEAGWKWQGFGSFTKYPRRGTYNFDVVGQDKPTVISDTGKELLFNDGGKAKLYGSVNYEMPLDCKIIIQIHRTFGSQEGIETQGVARMVNLAIYLSGPMMSSTESAAERRAELVELINDQAQRGVYQTTVKHVERPDQITGDKRWVAVVEITRSQDGLPRRQQGSILEQYSITLQPISVERIWYDDVVQTQIAKRQEATQQVQLSQANARKAQQDAITAEENGKKTAAEAKWAQETIKAKEVTLAQQKLEVATLAAREAEQFKREQILRGEGEAARKQLVMEADGALDAKLEAYVKTQAYWADAFAKFQGQMVPGVAMGAGTGGTAVGNAQSLIELLSVKAAKDLSVDLQTTGRAATATAPAKK